MNESAERAWVARLIARKGEVIVERSEQVKEAGS